MDYWTVFHAAAFLYSLLQRFQLLDFGVMVVGIGRRQQPIRDELFSDLL